MTESEVKAHVIARLPSLVRRCGRGLSLITDGGITGTMSATLSNGPTFTGPYLEVTSSACSDDLAPMWIGWRRGWADRPGWGRPDYLITTQYSGCVTAVVGRETLMPRR